MLTPAQDTALAAAIRADTDQAVIDALAIRNDVGLADLYNADSTFVVWRKSIQPADYRAAIVWTEVDTLTAGKARIWEWVTANMTQALDGSDLNVRQGIADAFGAGTTTRANLLAVAKRFATKCEALFATGTGTDADPGDLVFEGKLSHSDISRALNKNPA